MNENGSFHQTGGVVEEEEMMVVSLVAFLWAFWPFLLLSEDLSEVRGEMKEENESSVSTFCCFVVLLFWFFVYFLFFIFLWLALFRGDHA